MPSTPARPPSHPAPARRVAPMLFRSKPRPHSSLRPPPPLPTQAYLDATTLEFSAGEMHDALCGVRGFWEALVRMALLSFAHAEEEEGRDASLSFEGRTVEALDMLLTALHNVLLNEVRDAENPTEVQRWQQDTSRHSWKEEHRIFDKFLRAHSVLIAASLKEETRLAQRAAKARAQSRPRRPWG